MTYQFEHRYITVIGDCYGGAERWQFGLRMLMQDADNETAALALAPIVERWWRGTGYAAGNEYGSLNTYRLTELKVAHILQSGLYPADEASYSHFYLPAIAGQYGPVGAVNVAPQLTNTCTLTTGVPRGLGSKGRVYLPPNSQSITADGRLAAANAAQNARSMKQFINELNADGLEGPVMVMSRGRGVPSYNAEKKRVEYDYPTPGPANAVTGVRFGRVIDTQRRRRRSLVEDYQVEQLA